MEEELGLDNIDSESQNDIEPTQPLTQTPISETTELKEVVRIDFDGFQSELGSCSLPVNELVGLTLGMYKELKEIKKSKGVSYAG